jgi:hypothetical protein
MMNRLSGQFCGADVRHRTVEYLKGAANSSGDGAE